MFKKISIFCIPEKLDNREIVEKDFEEDTKWEILGCLRLTEGVVGVSGFDFENIKFWGWLDFHGTMSKNGSRTPHSTYKIIFYNKKSLMNEYLEWLRKAQ